MKPARDGNAIENQTGRERFHCAAFLLMTDVEDRCRVIHHRANKVVIGDRETVRAPAITGEHTMSKSSQSSSAELDPPIVYCPVCTTRPMAIKSVKTGVISRHGSVRYICSECGFETEEPLEQKI